MKKSTLFLLVVLQFIFTTINCDILFGQSSKLSGADGLSEGQHTADGILAAFKEVNDNGGIGGNLLKMIQMNDMYDATLAAANTKKLIEQYNATALIGNQGTGASTAAIGVAQQYKILTLCPVTGSDGLRFPFNPYVVHSKPSYFDETASMVNFIVNLKRKRRVAVLWQNDAFGTSCLSSITKSLGIVSLSPVSNSTIERSSLEVAAPADQIASGKPEAIILITTGNTASKFIDYVKNSPKFQNRKDLIFLFLSTIDPSTVANSLSNIDNVYFTAFFPSPFDSSYQLVRRYQKSIKNYNNTISFNYYNLEGYVSGLLAIELLRTSYPKLTSEGMIDALYSKKSFWIEDLALGPYSRNCSDTPLKDCHICNQGGKHFHIMALNQDKGFTCVDEGYYSWKETCQTDPTALKGSSPIVFGFGVESKNDPNAYRFMDAANADLQLQQQIFGKPIFMKMYFVEDLLADANFLAEEGVSAFFGVRYLTLESEKKYNNAVKQAVLSYQIPYYSTSGFFSTDDFLITPVTPYFYRLFASHYDHLIAIMNDIFNRIHVKRVDFILDNSDIGKYWNELLTIFKTVFLDRSTLVGSYDIDIKISVVPVFPSELEELDFLSPIIKSETGAMVFLGSSKWIATSITSCFYLPEGRKHQYYTVCSGKCVIDDFMTYLHPVAANNVIFTGFLPETEGKLTQNIHQFKNGSCTEPHECMGKATAAFIISQLTQTSKDALTSKDFNAKTLQLSIFSVFGQSLKFTTDCQNGGKVVALQRFVNDQRTIKFMHLSQFSFSACTTATHEADSLIYPIVFAGPKTNSRNSEFFKGFQLALDYKSKDATRKHVLVRTDGSFDELAALRKTQKIFAYVGHSEFVDNHIPGDIPILATTGDYSLKSQRSVLKFRSITDEIYSMMKYWDRVSKHRIGVIFDRNTKIFKDAEEFGYQAYLSYELGYSIFDQRPSFAIQDFFVHEDDFISTISRLDGIIVLANSYYTAKVISRIEYRTNMNNHISYGIPSQMANGLFNFQTFADEFNSTILGLGMEPKTRIIANGTETVIPSDGSYIFDKIITISATQSTNPSNAASGSLLSVIVFALNALKSDASSVSNEITIITPAIVDGYVAAQFLTSAVASIAPDQFLASIYAKSVHEVEGLGFMFEDGVCNTGSRVHYVSQYKWKEQYTQLLDQGTIHFDGCGYEPVIPSVITWFTILLLNLIIWPIVLLLLCCCFCCSSAGCVSFLVIRRTLILMNSPSGKRVVYCFTDIENSTKLWSLDPAGMRNALWLHDKIMRKMIKKCNGYEVKTQGDSFFIVFKHPVDALYFAMNLQFAMMHPKKYVKKKFCGCLQYFSWSITPECVLGCLFKRRPRDYSTKLLHITKTENNNENAHNNNEKPQNGRKDSFSSHNSSDSSKHSNSRHHKSNSIFRGLRVRIGLHVGDSTRTMDPVSSRFDFFGNDVNKAARIQHLGCGGQILISSEFFQLLNRMKSKKSSNLDNSSSQLFGEQSVPKAFSLQLLVPLTQDDEIIIQKQANNADSLMHSDSESDGSNLQETTSSKKEGTVPQTPSNKSLSTFMKKYNTTEQKKSMQIMKLNAKQKQKLIKWRLVSKRVANSKFEAEIGKLKFFYRKIGFFSFKGIAEPSLVIEVVHPLLVGRCSSFTNEEGDDGKAHATNQQIQEKMENNNNKHSKTKNNESNRYAPITNDNPLSPASNPRLNLLENEDPNSELDLTDSSRINNNSESPDKELNLAIPRNNSNSVLKDRKKNQLSSPVDPFLESSPTTKILREKKNSFANKIHPVVGDDIINS